MAENYECDLWEKWITGWCEKSNLGCHSSAPLLTSMLPQHFLCPSMPYRQSNSTPGFHNFYLLYSGLTLFLVPAASLIGPLTCLLWHCSLSLHCLASSSHALMFCGSAHPVEALRLILNLTCGWGLLKALLETQRAFTSSSCTALFCSSASSIHSLLRGPRLITFWTGHTCGGPAWLSFQALKVLWSIRQCLWGPTCDCCVISGRKESKLHILS